MLSCKEATQLMSAAQERPLSVAEKMQLKLHVTICKGCARFDEQMKFIRRACQGYLKRNGIKEDE